MSEVAVEFVRSAPELEQSQSKIAPWRAPPQIWIFSWLGTGHPAAVIPRSAPLALRSFTSFPASITSSTATDRVAPPKLPQGPKPGNLYFSSIGSPAGSRSYRPQTPPCPLSCHGRKRVHQGSTSNSFANAGAGRVPIANRAAP